MFTSVINGPTKPLGEVVADCSISPSIFAQYAKQTVPYCSLAYVFVSFLSMHLILSMAECSFRRSMGNGISSMLAVPS